MLDITNILFKPYTLIIIKNEDGQVQQGTVLDVTDDGIRVKFESGSIETLSPEALSHVASCYIGVPTIEEKNVSLKIRPNGKVQYFGGDRGMVKSDEGLCVLQKKSLASKLMRELASNGTLGGEDVLCLIDKKSQPHVGTIIEATSLDDALDAISEIAGEGKVSLALDFCNLVKAQFAGDEDVEAFSMRLEEEKKKRLGIDFYEGFPDTPRNMLEPYGRIYEINSENGTIIDAYSHKKLFFFRQQLFGQLATLKAKDLIGQPVLYSVKRGDRAGSYQARSIIKPMTFSAAYDIAEDLYYNLWQPISACDILRLITDQVDDPDYDSDLRSWSKNSQVRDGLWKNEELPNYTGPEESLRLPAPETGDPVVLKRQSSHMVVETGLTGVPEVPTIMSKSELAALTASVREAALAERIESTAPIEEMPDIETDGPVAEVSTLDLLELPSLIDCPDGERHLVANATVTIRLRSGSLFVEGEKRPFSFRPEDVIDPDLHSRAEMLSTNYVKDEKVVAQLSYTDRKATNICCPKTVMEMLTLAEDCIQEARGMDPAVDKDQMLPLYIKAEGFIDNVLDLVPANPVALTLKDIAEKAVAKYSDNCYKAPFNAVRPCGVIKFVFMKKGRAEVEDPHFAKSLHLPIENIIDTDYAKIRKGDELVYSVFRMRGVPVAQYVCLARPASELIKMAEQFEERGEYEKAWGIAMNILDSEPGHSYAISLSKRCQPRVEKAIVDERQKVLREDLFAKAQIVAIDGKPGEAISLYEKILSSQDDNPKRKTPCVYRLMRLFSELYHRNPADGRLKNEYKRAGEKYIKGLHGSPFTLAGESLEDLDCAIQFFEDMGETAELVKAYKAKRPLLRDTKGTRMEENERRELVAQVNANIAWNSLVMNDNSNDTEKSASWAMSDGNDLGRICHAVVLFRRGDGEKDIRKQIAFPHQAVEALEEDWVNEGASRVYRGTGPMKSLVYERYALLCRIVKGDNVLRDLARFLATMTHPDSEYREYLLSSAVVPDDCNLVQQVFICLQRGPSWPYWTDIRLLCMLSVDVAYRLCSIMYDLDPSVSAQVLIKDGIKILYENPQRKYFSNCFAEWRGGTIYNRYTPVLRAVKNLSLIKNHFDLDEGLDFFRDLVYEPWMVSDDRNMVDELHFRLPDMLALFFTAKDARTIMSTSRKISRNIDNWTDRIRKDPTILSRTAFFPLLVHIRDVVQNTEEEYKFDKPTPSAEAVSASSLGVERSMYLVVEIKNTNKNADAMRDCALKLKRSDDIRPASLDPVTTFSDTEKVYGGESLLYILHFKLNPDVDLNKLHATIQFSYRIRTTPEQTTFEIPFTVADQFEDLQNDYNFGGQDNKRFYGREHFIKNVSNVLSDLDRSPHFFIYGQKRSGKSSVLYQIKKRICEQLPTVIPVDINFLELDIQREEDIYFNILSLIFGAVEILNWLAEGDPDRDMLRESVLEFPAPEDLSFDLFVRRLTRLQAEMKGTRGWEKCKLVLFVDEFTKAYQWLKDGIIKKEFMWRWKGLQARGLFGAVLIGQDVLHAFIKETDGPNAFAVLEKDRLNYLEPEAARRLVTEPLFEAAGREDVYIGGAVDKIIYYSASSAHYTKWICYNLVNYMNARRLAYVTEADVDAAIWNALRNASEDDLETLFDPLYFSDITSEKGSRFKMAETISVLDAVADAEREDPLRGCRKSELIRAGHSEALIDDLYDRGVLVKEYEFYTLKVKLYNVWRRIKISMNRF